ncbi:MAG: class II fructose-bisphosphatase [Anaerolineales bacterium]|nr:class II fructose-bisphosphatase [Anaerolineales bacterium]
MGQIIPSHNVGLDLVRVTETTALAAGPWIGAGNVKETHVAVTYAMKAALDSLDMQGTVVIGEERESQGERPLGAGMRVGSGFGAEVDVLVDPIDGTSLLSAGRRGAISVVAVAPRGTIWSPHPAVYMEKIVVDQEAAAALVPECMNAPAAWVLALIARVKNKAVSDLAVIILDRPRHEALIDEIRAAGARILLRDDGDTEGAMVAATRDSDADVLMGIGGAAQGVLSACAVKALGGAMLARLAPQSAAERDAINAVGLDERRIYQCDDLVRSNQIFFAATAITQSYVLSPLRMQSGSARTHSLLLRTETGTRRFIQAEHRLFTAPVD